MDTIDWPGIRAAAISLNSVNAAAIQAGTGLPSDEAERLRERINKRALRERWLEHSKALAITAPTNAKPLSKPVQTGASIVANHLQQKKEKSRLNLAKFVVNASSVAAKSRKPLAIAQDVRHVSAVMTALWPEEGTKGLTLNLGVAIGGMQ